MSKNFITGIFLLVLILAMLWLMGSQEKDIDKNFVTLEKSREETIKWIENESPTYLHDGFDLVLINEETIIENSTYRFIFDFNSTTTGFGDRTEKITAQVITSHQMELIVDRGEVISAITDDIFSEIQGIMIKDSKKETLVVNMFFGREGYGEELLMTKREIPFTQETARAALSELINGPTTEEKNQGFFSLINTNTKIQNLNIRDSIAFVDFSEELEQEVAGSATVILIRSQIEKTLKQFESIDNVVISINGRTEDILQP